MAIQSTLQRLLLCLAWLPCLTNTVWGQNTTGVIRVNNGIPEGMRQITIKELKPALQKAATKLAVRNNYKTGRDWEDTVKYWTNEKALRAVSFINSSYEYTTVVFDQHGAWRQTTTYPNPEFKETSQIFIALEDKEYATPDLYSPVGPIIKYRTTNDTWYEVRTYENRLTQTVVLVVVDKRFRVIGVKK